MGNFISKNLALKVVSLFIASIIWFIAIRDHNPEINRRFDNIRVNIENEGVLEQNGLTLIKHIESETSIQVRGRAHDFIGIDTREFAGFVDLAKVTKYGDQYLPMEIRGLPQGMAIQGTPQIWVSIDVLSSKELPLILDLDVSEADGYKLHSYTLDPEGTVMVKGPSSVLDRIMNAAISLSLTEASQTIERSLPVSLYDRNGQLVQHEYVLVTPSNVIVIIPVYPIKTLPVNASLTGNPAYGYEVFEIHTYPSEITISGNSDLLGKISYIETEVLDIQNFMNDVRRTVRLRNYEGIRIVPGQATSVDIIVRIDEIIEEKIFPISDIETRNLPQNLRVQIEEDVFEVILRGPKLALDLITDEEVNLYIDLSDITIGEYNLPLFADVPDGIELVNISPQLATVNVN